nr:ribonuclease H-like domain-containing protein [Tanacetum cinerariifolium]
MASGGGVVAKAVAKPRRLWRAPTATILLPLITKAEWRIGSDRDIESIGLNRTYFVLQFISKLAFDTWWYGCGGGLVKLVVASMIGGAVLHVAYNISPYSSRYLYAVQQLCLLIHDPREPHFTTLKRVLSYVRGRLDFGLQLYASSTSSLVAYYDVVVWADCLSTWRSTSGYYVFLGDKLLTWHPNDYIHFLDRVLKLNIVDQRTKRIEINIHFVPDMVARGQVRVLHVSSRYQFADIFTKCLPSALLTSFVLV